MAVRYAPGLSTPPTTSYTTRMKRAIVAAFSITTLTVGCRTPPRENGHSLVGSTVAASVSTFANRARIRARTAALLGSALDSLKVVASRRGSSNADWPMTFALFDNLTIHGVVDGVTALGQSIRAHGHLQDSKGSFELVTRGDTLYCHIQLVPGRYFELRGRGGIVLIEEIDNGKLPSIEPSDSGQSRSMRTRLTVRHRKGRTDDGTVITVLVMYTETARDEAAAANGDAAGNSTAINLIIDAAEDEGKNILRNSGVLTSYAVVDREVTTFKEPNSNAPDEFLDIRNKLTAPNDGVLDEAHVFRELYKADVVVLLAADPNESGIAWIMDTPSADFENRAFAVVNWRVAAGNYTFAHEIGHILGARHNREKDPTDTPFPYAHGYQFIDGSANRFYTVMSYSWGAPSPGTRIPLYSSGTNMYNGVATGNAALADVARTINETRTIVANFR
jgi:Metallo-peptidase family M12